MTLYIGTHRASDFTCITIDLDNGNPAAVVAAQGGPSGPVTLGNYVQADAANAQAALDAFIDAAGYPWIEVGAVSGMTWVNGTKGILAVNLDQPTLSYSDGSTGVLFSCYAEPSFGYAPWGSYASAATALSTALIRSLTWSPTS